MIVKNEEENLPDCLRSVAHLIDEMIIVDTGSQDQTREIARQFGAKVYEFPWIDSFAAARNESLRHATGDFVFWLDADDRLVDTNRLKFKEFKGQLYAGQKAGFVMKCQCIPRDPAEGVTVVDHLRCFSLDESIRWNYRVHEQILPAIRLQGWKVDWADVMINHIGYQDPAIRSRKHQRDVRLLELDRQEQGDEPLIMFNLGMVHQEMGEYAMAIEAFKNKSLTFSPLRTVLFARYFRFSRIATAS